MTQAALRMLASRDHSREELRRKLSARSGNKDLLETVLNALEAERSLSDERFVEQYIESRKRKGYGPLRIRMELRDRHVNPHVIDTFLDERDPVWLAHLNSVAKKKFGEGPARDYREQTRRARFLEYRGFSPEMIRQLIWER